MGRYPIQLVVMVALLIPIQGCKREARPQASPQDLDVPLHQAIAVHNAMEFERLIRLTQTMVPFQKEGLLEVAIERCDPAIVKVLLKYGANPNSGVDGGPETPLLTASRVGCWEATEALLGAGAAPNGRQLYPWRRSPLYSAAHYGHIRVLTLLLGAGADPNLKVDAGTVAVDKPSDLGATPLMAAAKRGDMSMMDALLRKGADPTLKDGRGRSAADFLGEHRTDIDQMLRRLQVSPIR